MEICERGLFMSNNPEMAVKKTKTNIKAYKSIDHSGFFERFFAWCVDLVIIVLFGYAVYKLSDIVTAVFISFIFDFVLRVMTTYFWRGTPGKLLFGVRVVSRCSGKLSIVQVIIRELFKYISFLFIGLGYIIIMFSRRKRGLHDFAACTAVTSGGRDEASYARDIYTERPEKWDPYIMGPVILILVIFIAALINTGAYYLLYSKGMRGLSLISGFPVELKYRHSAGSGINTGKSLIQTGDIDGDGKYEVFREGVEEGKPFIRNVRLTSVQPVDGEIVLELDKPIIQYRLLDINGDKKDELAVLFEDKVLKIYKMDGEISEIGIVGPVEYNEINSVTKGKPADNADWRLYIEGDNNKLTIIYMDSNNIESLKFDLPGSDKIRELSMGVFEGKNYLIGATDNNRLVFYHYDGTSYKQAKAMDIPVRGDVFISINDLDMDKTNEIFICSPANDKRLYPVTAAYRVWGDRLMLMWDGGKYYSFSGNKYALSIDEALDIDRDGNLEIYTVQKKLSGEDGSYSIFIFQGDKTMMIVNDFMRILSLSTVK